MLNKRIWLNIWDLYEWEIITLFNGHCRLGGAMNKSHSIPNYDMLVIFFQQIKHGKLGVKYLIDIIKMK